MGLAAPNSGSATAAAPTPRSRSGSSVDSWDADRQRVRGRSSEASKNDATLANAEAVARDVVLSFRVRSRPTVPRDVRTAVAERLDLAAPVVAEVIE